jgi:cell wall-associated NlpC family hydrolase
MKRLTILLTTLAFFVLGISPSNAARPSEDDRASRSGARTSLHLLTISSAESLIGTRYCRGGQSPRCFDCSGFIKYIYGKQGVSLPGHVAGQMKSSTIVPKSEAVPGDLVFFVSKSGYPYHAGIYIGNNKIIHSPKPGRSVKIENIWSSRVKFGTIS